MLACGHGARCDGPIDESVQRSAPMEVYFIQAGQNGPIKIGVSKSGRSRARSLQVGHWMRLRLLAAVPARFCDEVVFHREFAEYAIEFEWFMPGPRLLELIDDIRAAQGGCRQCRVVVTIADDPRVRCEAITRGEGRQCLTSATTERDGRPVCGNHNTHRTRDVAFIDSPDAPAEVA